MRILLDLQGCQSASRMRGIGRYTLSLSKAIVRNAGSHEIWLVLNELFPDSIMPLRREFQGLVPQERIAVFMAPGPVADCVPENNCRARFAELIREHAIAELEPDIVHIGSLVEGCMEDAISSVGCLTTEIPTAVTLYDLIPFLHPDRYIGSTVAKNWYYRKIESLKRAELLFSISQFAGNEATSSLGITPERIVNIGAAADDRFHPYVLTLESTDAICQRFGLSSSFILYVGAIEARKNFDGLIRAYAQLPKELRAAHQLLLIAQGQESARDDLRRLAFSLDLEQGNVVVVDHVSDGDLVMLYNLCRLFVLPSLHEGFGLPALEAMACGAAVIGSNTTSIPEVIGRDDALFDPTSSAEMARVMRRALTDEVFYRSLRGHALERAQLFSWDSSAGRAIKAMEDLHRQRGDRNPTETRKSCYSSLISAVASYPGTLSNEYFLQAVTSIASNLTPAVSRQLLVDVSVLAESDAQTGIQRVTRAVLKELLSNPPSGYRVEPIRLDREAVRYRYARSLMGQFFESSSSTEPDEWIEARRGDIFLGLDLTAHLVSSVQSWLLGLRRHGVRVAFIVYDILPLLRPDWWRPAVGEVFQQWFKTIASTSDILIGISQAVVDDLRDYLGTYPPLPFGKPDLAFFHLGADIDSSVPTGGMPPGASEILGRLRTSPTFLMVGTVEPRKGHAQALSGFELLWAKGVKANLVIVGREGWLTEDLAKKLREHSMSGRCLFWLEGISDEYLKDVYSASTCLISASEAEGFGLPLVEAAQHGLPIIARDIPVFREIAGSHATYFSDTSPEGFADTISEWLLLSTEGKVPMSDGIRWLTWAESTEQLLHSVLPPAASHPSEAPNPRLQRRGSERG